MKATPVIKAEMKRISFFWFLVSFQRTTSAEGRNKNDNKKTGENK